MTDNTKYSTQFSHAFPATGVYGSIKLGEEDFFVEENLGFEPTGKGEHLYLFIEKKGLNTREVQQALAHFYHVPYRDVAYSGMKDKHALTRQWFSICTPSDSQPDADSSINGLQVLQGVRNSRKLKRGSHKGNSFRISIKNLDGDLDQFSKRLELISKHGVPNYYGQQRFGKDGQNMQMACDFFSREINNENKDALTKRNKFNFKRSLYLSSLRSWLFNSHLSKRVAQSSWNKYISGDVLCLEGTRSNFKPVELDAEIEERITMMDVHPSGPLWGVGELQVGGLAKELESALSSDYQFECEILESAGLKQERRPLRMKVYDLSLESVSPDAITITFNLNRGCYATSLIRELISER